MASMKTGAIRTALVVGSLLVSQAAFSSAIVAPHGAGRDADLSGNTVADPDDGGSALLINPAGVVGPARDEALVGLLAFNFTASYKNPSNGYDGTGSQTPLGIDMWYGLGEIAGWSLGFGAYGSIGAAFDLPPDPDIGIDSPYVGKLSIINVGFNAGRQLTDRLRVGLQITPRYGRQVVRLPTPLGNLDFTADGLGYSASVGLVFEPTQTLSFGLSYRSRGVVDMDGDANIGDSSESVDINFVTPEAIFGGVAYQWSKKLNLMAQVQWTSYEDFERGDIEFSETSALSGPTFGNTRDRARWGWGMEYEVVPNSILRAGYTVGQAMVEDDSVRPNLFDHDNHMLMLGYEIKYDSVNIGFTTGYMDLKDRNISAARNPAFPGKYSSDSKVTAGFRITWKLR